MDKPTVFLTMPRAGDSARCFEATRHFWHPGNSAKVCHWPHATSSLPQTFNDAWCVAINNQAKLGLTHFAMQHDDVVPDADWLNLLLAEMDDVGADILSAIVPIKSTHGLTSTALDRNSWNVRRMTLHEVFELPASFTADDLLVNTGLWICRMGEWMRNVHFQQSHAIKPDPITGELIADSFTEDWDFSRQARQCGKKIWATRKIGLYHERAIFHNRSPWGAWKRDEQHFVTAQRLSGYSETGFATASPWSDLSSKELADVPGWLSDKEGRVLGELATGRKVLEIGSYCGRSTIWLARHAKSVYCVDPFDARNTPGTGVSTWDSFWTNLRQYEVAHKVSATKAVSTDGVPGTGPFDLAFIDGDHAEASVRLDIELCLKELGPHGLLAFHDYGSPVDPGVKIAVDCLLAGDMGRSACLLGVTGSLAIVQLDKEPFRI